MVLVYSEPLSRQHYASRLSAAYCFRVSSLLGICILTIILAHTSHSFWLKVSSFQQQPAVRYTHTALLVVEGNGPGRERVWSTFKVVNVALHSKLASVDVQAMETDVDNDGKVDLVDIKLRVIGAGPVHSAKLLLGFTYGLQAPVSLQMQSLAYIYHSSPLPGAELHVDGELRLRQRQPLHFDAVRTIYNSPPLSPTAANGQLRGASAVQLQRILQDYLARNETTEYVSTHPVWLAGDGADFTIFARIRIPPRETVLYIPGVLEVLKFAWIQLVAIFVVLWYLLSWVEYVTFHYGVLQTRVVSDLMPRQHRF